MIATRYVATIADGGTDHDILFKIACCLLGVGYDVKHVELHQSLRDDMDRYWKKSEKNNLDAAKNLQKAVVRSLMAGFSEFKNEIGRNPTSADFLILNTDSERNWTTSNDYFTWAWPVTTIFQLGMETFRDFETKKGYSYNQLPKIIPIVIFPSTDKLIAAVRGKDFYGKKATELKHMLYGTSNLHQITPNQLNDYALDYITTETLNNIYSQIPEARELMVSVSSSYACLMDFVCCTCSNINNIDDKD